MQIPATWYVVDNDQTCFWVENEGNTFSVTVPAGNYDGLGLATALQTAFVDAGFTPAVNPVATYDTNNYQMTLFLDGWVDPHGNGIVGATAPGSTIGPRLIFFDADGGNRCGDAECASRQVLSQTLGWMMGFRSASTVVLNDGNAAPAVVSLYGPKYFVIVLDDFNQNHLNKGLVTISQPSNVLDVPAYYNTSQPYVCAPSDEVPTLLPSAPRTLTSAQLYTANEIIKNRSSNSNVGRTGRIGAPTNSDAFAIVPIKSVSRGGVYVEFSSTLQENTRVYFGPVDITRMRIRLLDDRGRQVDLHGTDWSATIIAECLYQY